MLSNTPTICLCSKTSIQPTGITTMKRISSFSKSKWRKFLDGSHSEFRGCCFQLNLIASGILIWWNTTIFLLVEYMTTGQITLRFVISAWPPRVINNREFRIYDATAVTTSQILHILWTKKTFARPSSAFIISVHFFPVLGQSATWNDHFWSFKENVNTQAEI